MKKKLLKTSALILVIFLSFIFVQNVDSALETQLLVDVSPSTDYVPYLQTQWYGFTAIGGKGYCAILSPSTGNSNLYLFDTNFNWVGYSKNTGTTKDKVWYGQSTTGPFHLACYGVANPSTNYTIQVITAPYVKTISPTSGAQGTLVTLYGFGFGDTQGSSFVKFGTVQATNYYSWTNTQIKVYVPSGVPAGIIQVIVYVASRPSNPRNFSAKSISSNGTMWRYDLGRTGNYPNGPTALPLSLKWTYTVGAYTYISSSPVISNGMIYLGVTDGKFYCFDANTGALKWSYTTGNQHSSSSAAIANGIVYIASSWSVGLGTSTIYYGKLYALDANTGSLKWSYAIGANVDTSPVVENGLVYFGSRNGKFYCLDANTGSLKWSYTCPGNYGILGSAAISNNIVYFVNTSHLFALDAITGVLKWKTFVGYDFVYTTPAISNNMVFVNNSLELRAFDAQTGILKWKYTGQEGGYCGCWSSAAVANGMVYAWLGTYNLYALDANTGNLRWSYRPGYQTLDSSPAVSNNIIYLAAAGKLYALDATNGSVKWFYDIGPTSSSPGIMNGRVYIGAGNKLYCFGQ